MIRDYTIHLKVKADRPFRVAEIDHIVANAVEWSTARDAIDLAVDTAARDKGYTVGRGIKQEKASIRLENFYVVANVRPEGGIE